MLCSPTEKYGIRQFNINIEQAYPFIIELRIMRCDIATCVTAEALNHLPSQKCSSVGCIRG